MSDSVLALLMLAGFVLSGAGLYRWLREGDRKNGALMMIAGGVMFGNVAIWTIPL